MKQPNLRTALSALVALVTVSLVALLALAGGARAATKTLALGSEGAAKTADIDALVQTGDHSIAFWFRRNAGDGTGKQFVAISDVGGGANYRLRVHCDSTPWVTASFKCAAGTFDVYSFTAINTGVWHHYAVVIDAPTAGAAGSITFYLDGVSQGTPATLAAGANMAWSLSDSRLVLGQDDYYNAGWGSTQNADLFEFSLWDRVLSSSEIDDWGKTTPRMLNTTERADANLLLYYIPDDGLTGAASAAVPSAGSWSNTAPFVGTVGYGTDTPSWAVAAPTAAPTLSSTGHAVTTVDLSWTSVSGATGYKLYRDGALIATQAGTTYQDTGLSPSTAYAYTVRAYNAGGDGPLSDPATSVTTDAAPPDTTDPTAGAVSSSASHNTITLNVGAGSDNVGIASRTIRLYSDIGFTEQVGGDVSAVVGDNTLTGLSPETTYWWRVVYADLAGNTATATGNQTTQAAPAAAALHLQSYDAVARSAGTYTFDGAAGVTLQVSVKGQEGDAALASTGGVWASLLSLVPAGTSRSTASYQPAIGLMTSPNGAFFNLEAGAFASSWLREQQDLGLSTTAWHTYTLTYVWGAGGSTIRVWRDGVEAEAPLTGTTAITYASTDWAINIGGAYDNTKTVNRLIGDARVYDRALTEAEVTAQWDVAPSASFASWSDLVAWYRPTSQTGGDTTLEGDAGSLPLALSGTYAWSDDLPLTLRDPAVPDHLALTTAPDLGTAGFPFATQPVVTVETQYDEPYALEERTVTASKVSGPGALTGTLAQTTASGVATWTDLGADTPGDYVIRFTTTGLVTNTVDTATLTVVAPPPAPGAPSNLAYADVTATTAGLTWTGGSDATQHRVYRDGALLQGAIAGTSTTLTGLSPATSYTLTVRAWNVSGESADSNSVTFTTPAAPANVTVVPLVRTAAFYVDLREVAPTLWDDGAEYGPWEFTGNAIHLEWSNDGKALNDGTKVWKAAQDFVRVQSDRFRESNPNPPDPRMATMLFGLLEGQSYDYRVTFDGPAFTALTATGTFTTSTTAPPAGTAVTLALGPSDTPPFHDVINAAVGADGTNDVVEFQAAAPGGTVTYRGAMATFYDHDMKPFDADGSAAGWLTVRGRAGDTVIFDGSDPDYDVTGADMWDLYTDAGLGITAGHAIYRTKVQYYDHTAVLAQRDVGVMGGAGLRAWPNIVCYERPPATDAWRLQDISEDTPWQTENSVSYYSEGLATMRDRAVNYPGEGGFARHEGYLYVRLHDGLDPDTQRMKVAVYRNPLDVHGAQYVRFENLKFRYYRGGQFNSVSEKVAAGIGVGAASHIQFHNIHLQGVGYGIHTIGGTNARDNIIISSCTFEEHGTAPEFIGGSWWSPNWPHLKASREEDWAVRLNANAVSVLDCTVDGYHNGVTAGEPQQDSPPSFAPNTAYPSSWEIDNNVFSRCLDDAVEMEMWVVAIAQTRNTATQAVYKHTSMAPIMGGPVYNLRNTFYGAGEFGSMVYKQAMYKLGNGNPGDVGYKLLANNTQVAGTPAGAPRPLVGLSASGRSYNLHVYNNYVAADTLGVEWGDGALGYPHHFDRNRYVLSRKEAQFPGYTANLFGQSAGADLQADLNFRRYLTFAAWQAGVPDLNGPAMPVNGSLGLESYVPQGTQNIYNGTYPRYWTHDPNGSYREGAHELADPANGDFTPTGSVGTGADLANITYDVGPAWSAYEEADPTPGAVPYAAPGATYATDFSEYTTGVAPSDWTARWNTTNSTWSVVEDAGALGGKVLRHTATAAGNRLLSWNDIDADADRADVEVLVKLRTTSRTLHQGGAAFRANADPTGYYARLHYDTFANLRQSEWNGGAGGEIITEAFTWTADTWYWLRLRVNGTTIQARTWADGSAEPGTWLIDRTDASIAAAGWVGLVAYTETGTRDYDWFSVATGGGTAPSPTPADLPTISVPNGATRVGSSITVTVTATSTDPGGVTSFSDISVTGPSGSVLYTRGSDSGIGTATATTSITFTPLATGTYTVTATANDAAGSATDTGTVTVSAGRKPRGQVITW